MENKINLIVDVGNGEKREILVYANDHGNLVLEGIGNVNYELLNDELSFVSVKN